MQRTFFLTQKRLRETVLALVLVVWVGSGSAADAAPRSSLKLLTIGNCFAGNVTHYLPSLAKAGGKTLVLFPANIGGASLEKQVQQAMLFEDSPEAAGARPYSNRIDSRTGQRRDFSLREALEAEPWDVVTIQQASRLSFKPESYEPHAGRLIEFIRKHAPTAEIVVHQTWAYREDHPFFQNERLPKEKHYSGAFPLYHRLKGTYREENQEDLTPDKMYARLRVAYRRLAEAYHLRVIPVGDAFHAARQTPQWAFSYRDPKFNYENPVPGTVPSQIGSLNPGWRWETNAKTGRPEFTYDGWHANSEGMYLGACVVYELLYEDSVLEVEFTPPGLRRGGAAQLRQIAHQTAARYRQQR